MNYSDRFTADLVRLFKAYCAATGASNTAVAAAVADDKGFLHRIRRTSPSIATIDRVVGRFAGIWPEGEPWPADIPRPEPIALTDGVGVPVGRPRKLCPHCGKPLLTRSTKETENGAEAHQ